MLHPRVVPEHNDRVTSGYDVFVGSKRASQVGFDAHRGEEVAAHQRPEPKHRRRHGIRRERERQPGESGQSVEAPIAIAYVDVFGIRSDQAAEALHRGRRPDGQDIAGTRHGKRPEQQRVRKAEHRGIGTDANRQRDNGNDGEPAVSTQHPPAVAQVAGQMFQPGKTALIAKRFQRVLDVPGPKPRRSGSTFR
jgi:hypothetical protein